jgi:hypothetical protein
VVWVSTVVESGIAEKGWLVVVSSVVVVVLRGRRSSSIESQLQRKRAPVVARERETSDFIGLFVRRLLLCWVGDDGGLHGVPAKVGPRLVRLLKSESALNGTVS